MYQTFKNQPFKNIQTLEEKKHSKTGFKKSKMTSGVGRRSIMKITVVLAAIGGSFGNYVWSAGIITIP